MKNYNEMMETIESSITNIKEEWVNLSNEVSKKSKELVNDKNEIEKTIEEPLKSDKLFENAKNNIKKSLKITLGLLPIIGLSAYGIITSIGMGSITAIAGVIGASAGYFICTNYESIRNYRIIKKLNIKEAEEKTELIKNKNKDVDAKESELYNVKSNLNEITTKLDEYKKIKTDLLKARDEYILRTYKDRFLDDNIEDQEYRSKVDFIESNLNNLKEEGQLKLVKRK